MKISLIIPHYEVNLEKRQMLLDCLATVAGQYDELIIIAEKRENLASKINDGLRKASGEFLMVSNDDIKLIKGTLNDLCDPEVVTVPKVIGSIDKLFHGHFWCMPRKIFEKVGFMYEGYDGFYYDDSDYWMTIESKGFKIVKREDVVILHDHPASTLKHLYKDGREENNRKIFIERWGIDALRRIT